MLGRFTFLVPLGLGLAATLTALGQANLGSAIKLQDGFKATLYSGPDLANDIYSMTLDAKGQVVVSSRGYIRTLHDTDGDNRADKAILFAKLDHGSMGMMFDGPHLWAVANRALLRYKDANDDGRADGPPRQFLRLANGEHGSHAIRKGPDGWLYLVGGNNTGFRASQFNSPQSPLKETEGGAIIRFSPDGEIFEALACGFRNPYDFDFNWRGDMFAYDSDTERTFFLPWYTPTRLYHVAIGGHHGWRMPGHKRSWARPGYYSDTVPALHKVGRGSPTGVVVYRHRLFPKEYHDGVFILDWTFGNIWFYPLKPSNASYQALPQLFLSPIGTDGFAPSDIEVGVNGELFVSIGGRNTKGAVFRIVPTKRTLANDKQKLTPQETILDDVLNAPQPLVQWSRTQWQPKAKIVGAAHFVEAAMNTKRVAKQRVRAIEVITEMFGGLKTETAGRLANDSDLDIRARTAWSIGRFPRANAIRLLAKLAVDPEDFVRARALEAMLRRLPNDPRQSGKWLESIEANFNRPSIRIRLISARLASRLPDNAWQKIPFDRLTTQGKVTAATAMIWRKPETDIHTEVVQRVLPLIDIDQTESLNTDIVRTIILALGDYNLDRPSRESFTGYESPHSLEAHAGLAKAIATQVTPLMDTIHEDLHREAGRLLAMVGAGQPQLASDLLRTITADSDPVDDFHKLIVMAKLPSTIPDADLAKLADSLMGLDAKLQSRSTRPKLNWTMRFVDIAQAHGEKQPGLAKRLVAHKNFPTGSHLTFALTLKNEVRQVAAKRYLAEAQSGKSFNWSNNLIDLLDTLPAETVLPILRSQWPNHGLRPAILKHLAKRPTSGDRHRFLDALLSRDSKVSATALTALRQLSPSNQPSDLAKLIRKLRRECGLDGKAVTRKQIVNLLTKWSGQPLAVPAEKSAKPDELIAAWQPLFDWFATVHPNLAAEAIGSGLVNAAKWEQTLAKVDWSTGDAKRGSRLFANRACQGCHSGAGALGPDLKGSANRFSPKDLYRAILFPNRDISPLYRFTEYRMRNGDVHTGRTAFYAAEGVVLRTGVGIVRLDQADIQSTKPSQRSIMPEGLLEGLGEGDLADLFQYIKSL